MPLAKKSTANQHNEHVEKYMYIQWVTTLSLTIIRVYLHSFSSCWLSKSTKSREILRKFELIAA